MKRLAVLALAFAAFGCSPEKPAPAEEPVTTTTTGSSGSTGLKEDPKPAANVIGELSSMGAKIPVDGEEVAVMETKFGRILLRFYHDKAPGHVENFKTLARKGFYDGTKFHRIMPGFMIQGGDPNSKDSDPSNDGMGDPGYKIDAEFNEIPHDRGILSMARSNDVNSAGSQFFIVHQSSKQTYEALDTKYTVFGRVCADGTEKDGEEPAGLKVVDKIVSGKTNGEIAVDPVPMKVTIQKWPIK